MDQRKKAVIRLETERELRIYMLPLRQRILRTLRIAPAPMTSKQVADMLGIAPSSARHHLLKLRELGVVEHDRFEMINGIRAEYVRASDADVSIGTNTDDATATVRDALTTSILSDITGRFLAHLPIHRERSHGSENLFSGDFLGGIAHLSEEDARSFFSMVRTFLDAHVTPKTSEERPWEFAIILHEVVS
jgi:DNA-binding transcriptional ArsR family regulator